MSNEQRYPWHDGELVVGGTTRPARALVYIEPSGVRRDLNWPGGEIVSIDVDEKFLIIKAREADGFIDDILWYDGKFYRRIREQLT